MSQYCSGWLRAPAKINLTLRVTGRRADGYHLLDSLVAPLSLGDRMLCRATDKKGDATQEFHLRVPDFPELAGEDTIVVRVGRAFTQAIGFSGEISGVLFKAIPIGAGLGGGSSDAASLLAWLNQTLPKAQWPLEKVAAFGARFGADIPLFIHGGICRMQGIGELVTPVPMPAQTWVVMAKPAQGCPTQQVYKRYDELGGSRAPRAGTPAVHNDLFDPALSLCPEIDTACADLTAAGATDVRLSGSGSTCYALCETRAAATAVSAQLPRREGWWYNVARVIGTR